MMKFDQMKMEIDKRTIISFDLFDTLIKRDCYKPTELFYFIEREIDQEYGVQSHFASIRVQAEKDARKKSKAEEVSLDEIYDEIFLPFPSMNKGKIKQKEEEYEYKACQWNPLMKPVYEYCRKQRKKIFIITDIYLSENLIKRILWKLGIQYDALYVSSTLKKMKRNGTLFSEVLKQTGNHPTDMLHIGDNKQSDYLMPKKLGIHAVHISKDKAVNLFVNHKLYKQNPRYANLCAFINNHVDTHSWNAVNVEETFDFFSEAGYETQGPVLYGYVNWLQEQFKTDGIEKVFFLARDGQLMQKAYRKLDHLLPNKYMYASRKALIIPSLWMTPSIQEIKRSIYWGKRGTISSFLKKIGLAPADFEQYYVGEGFSLNDVYEYENLWENQIFLDVFEEHIKKNMIAHSREAYALLVQYLKQLDFSGKVAVVDIGWFGHMQGALEKIVKEAHIPVEIHGYYLGLRPESPILNYIQAKGYLFDQNHDQILSEKENAFNAIVEMLFTADHGTTNGYKLDKGCVIPILGKWEYEKEELWEDYVAIRAYQQGALAFIDDNLKKNIYFSINLDPAIIFANWIQLGCNPRAKVAKIFGNIHFLDDSVAFLAKPQNISSYFLCPKRFLFDFKNTYWQMGFLARIFGDYIPYMVGYRIMHKIYSFVIKI